MRPRRGTAITPDASAELQLPRSAPPRHRHGASPADPGRFSPLNAPQRAAVEAFLEEARPWAMRQARRSYRHLPGELHEEGFKLAGVALCTGAPSALDRRSLYAGLAHHLDDELRRIHVGWCLNQSPLPTQAPPSETGPSAQQPIAAFIEDGLGGLERAVLQLELGAGRDTSTVRAALRLGPRQYGRHREMGLGKLRGAITGTLRGRVCDQHLDAVTLAATGDRGAAERLASGPERCRACAREASGLHRVLQQRLALAPWPFVIKPAGAVAAKVGALGALLGGKSAAAGMGGGFVGTASGAKVVAGVVAVAAVASGGIAKLESEQRTSSGAPAAKAAGAPAGPAQPVSRAAAATPAAGGPAAREATRRAAASRKKAREQDAAAAPAATATAQAEAQAQHPTSPEPVAPAKPKPTGSVGKTVDGVKKTVDDLTGRVVPGAPKVDDLVPGLDQAVDDVTGAVDGILAP